MRARDALGTRVRASGHLCGASETCPSGFDGLTVVTRVRSASDEAVTLVRTASVTERLDGFAVVTGAWCKAIYWTETARFRLARPAAAPRSDLQSCPPRRVPGLQRDAHNVGSSKRDDDQASFRP
jgi:hypothetical protein